MRPSSTAAIRGNRTVAGEQLTKHGMGRYSTADGYSFTANEAGLNAGWFAAAPDGTEVLRSTLTKAVRWAQHHRRAG